MTVFGVVICADLLCVEDKSFRSQSPQVANNAKLSCHHNCYTYTCLAITVISDMLHTIMIRVNNLKWCLYTAICIGWQQQQIKFYIWLPVSIFKIFNTVFEVSHNICLYILSNMYRSKSYYNAA